MTRLVAVLFLMLLCPLAVLGQADDCETFAHEIDVTTTAPPVEIEQIPITLHRYHEQIDGCSNFFPDQYGESYSVPSSCSKGNRITMVQGSMICNRTSGPNGSSGCSIHVRMRCGSVNHYTHLTCRSDPDGRLPDGFFNAAGAFCNNLAGTQEIHCSGNDLMMTTCPGGAPYAQPCLTTIAGY